MGCCGCRAGPPPARWLRTLPLKRGLRVHLDRPVHRFPRARVCRCVSCEVPVHFSIHMNVTSSSPKPSELYKLVFYALASGPSPARIPLSGGIAILARSIWIHTAIIVACDSKWWCSIPEMPSQLLRESCGDPKVGLDLKRRPRAREYSVRGSPFQRPHWPEGPRETPPSTACQRCNRHPVSVPASILREPAIRFPIRVLCRWLVHRSVLCGDRAAQKTGGFASGSRLSTFRCCQAAGRDSRTPHAKSSWRMKMDRVRQENSDCSVPALFDRHSWVTPSGIAPHSVVTDCSMQDESHGKSCTCDSALIQKVIADIHLGPVELRNSVGRQQPRQPSLYWPGIRIASSEIHAARTGAPRRGKPTRGRCRIAT